MTKILLVEDDKSLREIYGVRLLAEGYDIVSAGDGEEALAMAIKERPTLIVSDVMMPKISGFDMLDILRSTTETKDIKVIMMTALSSEDQRLRGEQLGADRYLVKSQVGIEDVVRTVHDVLQDIPSANTSPQPTFGTPAPSAVPRTSTPAPASRPPAPPTTYTADPSTSAPEPVRPSAPSAPQPSPEPVAPAPQPSPEPAPSSPASLPQPTAPFSTPRPSGLGDRIIHPLEAPEPSVDIASLMDQELSQTAPSAAPQNSGAAPATAPTSPSQPQPEFDAASPVPPTTTSQPEAPAPFQQPQPIQVAPQTPPQTPQTPPETPAPQYPPAVSDQSQ